jgi:phosphoglycerate dehydrogenase-like enzyme
MTPTTTGTDRGVPQVRVLLGTERFSSQHSWSELTALMAGALQASVDVHWCPPPAFAERARNESFDVVVPFWAELNAQTIHAGQFRLIQQFGAGVENIDIAAATSAGVWVANMPGLNAVDVAEHAVLLLLALLRRLPEAPSGFDPGRWGDPPGEALAGSTVCIVGLGAVGSQLARRLDPFEARLIGVRRDVRRGAPPTTPDIEIVGADRIHDALRAADAVILTASHEPGRPPLIDRAALAAMRLGARLVNVARGALIDEAALLEALDEGRLAGAGLDVFAHEPYPASGSLAHHPKVIATAHNAALTTSYFRRAARALGEALAAQLDDRRPPNALNAPLRPRQSQPEHRTDVAARSAGAPGGATAQRSARTGGQGRTPMRLRLRRPTRNAPH